MSDTKFDPEQYGITKQAPAVPELNEEDQAKAELLGGVIEKHLKTLSQGEKLAIKRRYDVTDFTDDADLVMIVCARQKGRALDEYQGEPFNGTSWGTYEAMTDDQIVDFLVDGERAPEPDPTPPSVTEPTPS